MRGLGENDARCTHTQGLWSRGVLLRRFVLFFRRLRDADLTPCGSTIR